MKTKLTLSIDDRLIPKSKAYARRFGKSVSQLVEDLLHEKINQTDINFSIKWRGKFKSNDKDELRYKKTKRPLFVMIVLLDTDVLIDVALDRDPHVEYSAKILDLAQAGLLEAYIAWHSISNFYYIVSSEKQHRESIQFIRELLQFVRVAETSTENAVYATQINMPDFEDALQIAAAQSCKAQFIVTRNIKHYKKSPIQALEPLKLLQLQ